MAKRLTDRKKKVIIADYIEMGSYNAVAKKHKVALDTVRRAVLNDPDFARNAKHKKEQNTTDILEHMETKRDKVCAVIDRYLDALLDDERIEKATPAQLTTAMGTLIDKFTMGGDGAERRENNIMDVIQKSAREVFTDAVSAVQSEADGSADLVVTPGDKPEV